MFHTARYRTEFPAHRFADLDAARQWAMYFVHWYHNEHRHSGIRYVTPAQQHAGEDIAILAARERHPARWSGQTRNWTPSGSVALYPERDAIVNEVGIRGHKQAHVA